MQSAYTYIDIRKYLFFKAILMYDKDDLIVNAYVCVVTFYNVKWIMSLFKIKQRLMSTCEKSFKYFPTALTL